MTAFPSKRTTMHAAPHRDPASTPAWTALALLLPKHLIAGYINIALVFSWREAGASATVLAGLIATGMLPQLLSLVLAPLVDSTLSLRKWWLIGAAGSLALLAALLATPMAPGTLGTLALLVFATQLSGGLLVLVLDVAVTATVAPARKAAANAWALAGKYLGLALGSGGGIWLAKFGGTLAVAWFAIMAMTACSGLALLLVAPSARDVQSERRRETVGRRLRTTFGEVGAFFRSRQGLRIALFCMLPIGLGTTADMWAIFAGHWHAGEGVIGFLQSSPVELVTLAGIVIGAFLAGRSDPTRAFFGWSMINALLVVALAVSPRQPYALIAGALLYGLLFGITQILSVAVIYELIGERSGASKVSICMMLLNVPAIVVVAVNGWLGDRFGVSAVLIVEALLTVVSFVVFALVFPGSLGIGRRLSSSAH